MPCTCCATDPNITGTSLLGTTVEEIFRIVKRQQSLFNSMSPLLFCAIVAVLEVEVGR